MHFEENQLSLRSIGISPLPTPHPSILQHTSVRSSTTLYCRFNLDMGRSRSFGSNARHYRSIARPIRLIQTRFRSAYATKSLKQPRTLTRRLILQKARGQTYSPPTACKHTVSGSISLRLQRFFSPFPHGTSSLSVACEYLALGDGPPRFMQGSSYPALLGCRKRV